MKKAVRRAGFLLSGIAAACAVTYLAAHYIFYPAGPNATRIRGFYLEQENSLDIACMGSSNVAQGLSPVEGYLDTGLTSYAYATDAATAGDWIPMAEEILRKQDPKLLLVEVNGALYYESDPIYDTVWTRVLTDGMEEGEAREELISDITKNPIEQLSLRYPFLFYHGNLEDAPYTALERIEHRVTTENRGYLLIKGFTPTMRTFAHGNLADTANAEALDLAPNYEAVLREFLDYCKEKDLPVLFFRMPTCISEADSTNFEFYQRSLAAAEIIEEYGFPYLDLQQMSEETGLDMETDFSDPSHLNIFGNEKITKFLYQYVKDQYGIAPSHGEVSEEWDACSAFYEKALPCIEEATVGCRVSAEDLKGESQEDSKDCGSVFRETPSTVKCVENGEGLQS